MTFIIGHLAHGRAAILRYGAPAAQAIGRLAPHFRTLRTAILDWLASGTSEEEILDNYPGLERADILACIAYGAEMSRDRYVEIPIEGRPCG